MNWTRNSPYSLISDDGRYGIAKCTVKGEIVYTAIRLGIPEYDAHNVARNWKGSERIGQSFSPDECKAICEAETSR